MTMLILDPDVRDRLLAERQAIGADRFDEVWDGVYVMSPLANNEHQLIASALTTIFQVLIGWPGLGLVQAGANVSDRADDWTRNYRVPDIVVYLRENPAQNRDTHWLGGPDLAVEIVSEGDRISEKLEFYARVKTREVLVVKRRPWSLELHRLNEGALVLAGESTLERPEALPSEVLPLRFCLEAAEPRPAIVVEHHDGRQRWVV